MPVKWVLCGTGWTPGGALERPEGSQGAASWVGVGTLAHRSCGVSKTALQVTHLCLALCCHRELRLRNYVPEDEDLKRRRVPQAKPVAGGQLLSQPLGLPPAASPGRCPFGLLQEAVRSWSDLGAPGVRSRSAAGRAGSSGPQSHQGPRGSRVLELTGRQAGNPGSGRGFSQLCCGVGSTAARALASTCACQGLLLSGPGLDLYFVSNFWHYWDSNPGSHMLGKC